MLGGRAVAHLHRKKMNEQRDEFHDLARRYENEAREIRDVEVADATAGANANVGAIVLHVESNAAASTSRALAQQQQQIVMQANQYVDQHRSAIADEANGFC